RFIFLRSCSPAPQDSRASRDIIVRVLHGARALYHDSRSRPKGTDALRRRVVRFKLLPHPANPGPMSRPLYAQLSLPALRGNIARARALAPNTELIAVVKANAYGHGLMRVLPALADADGLALVELDAAVALRDARYTRRILLLEGFFAAEELS